MRAYHAHFEEQGIVIPADFFPPDMPLGAGFYISAFQRLAADRPVAIGFGAVNYGRIPFVAIERFAARAGIVDADEFALFDRVICAVDAKDVALVNQRANAKNK